MIDRFMLGGKKSCTPKEKKAKKIFKKELLKLSSRNIPFCFENTEAWKDKQKCMEWKQFSKTLTKKEQFSVENQGVVESVNKDFLKD